MLLRRAGSWLVPALALVALAACEKGVRKPDKMDPVTIDEARKLAADFGAALSPCDAARAGALLDGDNLVRRAVEKTKLPAEIRRHASNDVGGSDIAGMLCQGIPEGATYKLLRIREGGQPRPLFRLIANDSVNYHELELGKSRKDQQVRVVDIHVYATGELLSDTLADLFQHAFTAMKTDRDADRIDRQIADIKEAQVAGDSAKAYELIGKLPPGLRNSKSMRLAEVMVGADLDEATYTAMLERYRRDFPDDPSVDIVSVDYHYMKKDVEGAVAAVERLDKLVGGDPYLSAMRTSAYLLDDKHLAEAERHARAAVAAEPGLEAGWWALAMTLLRKGDHAGVVPVAATLKAQFGADVVEGEMADEALWAPYFASDAYQQSRGAP